MKNRTLMIFLIVLLGVAFAAPALSAKPIKLKFANYFPPPARHSTICEEFIAELSKRTDGRVEIQYFTGGSLLKAPAIYNGIVTGIADIGLAHIEYTPGRFPVSGACELPLGYPSAWVANQVANDFYNTFKPKEWDDVRVLWMHSSNPNVMITAKKPARKLEDLKGMTIRAPGIVGYTVSALGATPAPTPVMEVYDAMSKGVIDGVNIPFETLKTFRFGEVAKYVTSSWQVGNVYTFFVAMNKNSYAKLPPDIKEIFDILCGEFKERFALAWNLIDFEGMEFARDKGVEILELSDDEVARWQKATESVVEDYVKERVQEGFSEAEARGWIKFLRERIDYWTAKQLMLRIKSPTGPAAMRP
jgi:TRAP-type transport system periplasmic protein